MDGATVGGSGSQGDEGESDLLVFAEADCGDGLGFGVPEEAKVLLHAGPVPAAVSDVVEIGGFDFANEAGGIGEEVFRGGVDETEAVAEREAEAPNAGQEIDPGKEEPQAHSDGAGAHAGAEEVEGEEGGDKEGEGTDLSQQNCPARSEGDSDDDAGKDN